MMPTGHQSEIRNKAVFPSPPKERLTERVETGYPQGNIRERTGMHNAQCIMYKTGYVNYLFLIVN